MMQKGLISKVASCIGSSLWRPGHLLFLDPLEGPGVSQNLAGLNCAAFCGTLYLLPQAPQALPLFLLADNERGNNLKIESEQRKGPLCCVEGLRNTDGAFR